MLHQPQDALVIVWPHARLPGVCQSFSGRNGVTWSSFLSAAIAANGRRSRRKGRLALRRTR